MLTIDVDAHDPDWPKKTSDVLDADGELRGASYDESKHPRHPAGSSVGGQWASEPGAPGDSSTAALSAALLDKVGGRAKDLINASKAVRAKMKAAIVRDVARRAGITPKQAQGILDLWAETSAADSPHAVDMQHAVIAEFGVKGAATDHLGHTSAHMIEEYGDEAGVDPFDSGAASAFLRAEYAATQDFFKSAGITHVTVYRGEMEEEGEGDITVRMQPASSWTTSPAVAAEFAQGVNSDGGNDGRVLSARVPVSRILSTCVTGRGCVTESEVILLGGKMRVRSHELYADDEERRNKVIAELSGLEQARPRGTIYDIDADPRKANWPKRTRDAVRDLVPDAARDLEENYDESKHPRDERGRWTDKDGTPSSDSAESPQDQLARAARDEDQPDWYTPGDTQQRVVWGIKRGDVIKLSRPGVRGIDGYDELHAVHVGDPDYWKDRLVKDYDRDESDAAVIDIRTEESDVLMDDPQYATDPDTGDKADSNVLLTARDELVYGRDWVFEGEEFTPQAASRETPPDVAPPAPDAPRETPPDLPWTKFGPMYGRDDADINSIIDMLPTVGPDIDVPKAMGKPLSKGYMAGARDVISEERKLVRVSDLIPTQRTIGATKKSAFDTASSIADYIRGTASGQDLPINVDEADGKYYVADGHHRTVAAIINGEKYILADIKHLGKPKFANNPVIRDGAEWDESLHPRDDDGKFAPASGTGPGAGFVGAGTSVFHGAGALDIKDVRESRRFMFRPKSGTMVLGAIPVKGVYSTHSIDMADAVETHGIPGEYDEYMKGFITGGPDYPAGRVDIHPPYYGVSQRAQEFDDYLDLVEFLEKNGATGDTVIGGMASVMSHAGTTTTIREIRKWMRSGKTSRAAAEWDPALHPRDDEGQFTESGSAPDADTTHDDAAILARWRAEVDPSATPDIIARRVAAHQAEVAELKRILKDAQDSGEKELVESAKADLLTLRRAQPAYRGMRYEMVLPTGERYHFEGDRREDCEIIARQHAEAGRAPVVYDYVMGRNLYYRGGAPSGSFNPDLFPHVKTRTMRNAAEWDPALHPRDDDGKFTESTGVGAGADGDLPSDSDLDQSSSDLARAYEILDGLERTDVVVGGAVVKRDPSLTSTDATDALQDYASHVPDSILREARVSEILVCEDANVVDDTVRAFLMAEGMSPADMPPEAILGVFHRPSRTIIATTREPDDEGRVYYHELGHTLESKISSPDWEEPWLDEWSREHDQDEGFAEAVSQYYLSKRNDARRESGEELSEWEHSMADFRRVNPLTYDLFQKWGL